VAAFAWPEQPSAPARQRQKAAAGGVLVDQSRQLRRRKHREEGEMSEAAGTAANATSATPAEDREVSWLQPCYACGGTEGCGFIPPHTIYCQTLDNDLGRPFRQKEQRARVVEYDARSFRHAPPVAQAAALLRRYFFNRIDIVCHLAKWKAPCPAHGGDNLDSLLRAHCFGRERGVTIHWFSNNHPEGGEVTGCYKIGSYGPAPDGTTRWLCADFDGGGEHSAPLSDPLAIALSVYRLCYCIGLSAYLERSGSARGWHLWVFFDPPLAAKKARKLGHAIVPYDADLTDGSLADPESGTGIEVFPKCDSLRAGGVGNQVWCPWYWKAKPGGGLFYRHNPRGFEPFVPEGFDTVAEAQVDEALLRLRAGEVAA
jgi:hypothetical protein